MTIEVTGTGTGNKGAELMLVAIRQYVEQHHPDARLVVDRWFGTYEERAKYGLWLKVDIKKWGRARVGMQLLPDGLRKQIGLVSDSEVDIMLDAAGFAFGDQHPVERTVRFADQIARAKKAGKKVILLPQAFGPFEKKEIRDAFKRIVDHADLVFARDPISLAYAQQAVGDVPYLLQAPDFTSLVKPKLDITSEESDRVCIVPNQRMIEKATDRTTAEAYINMLANAVQLIHDKQLQPFLLIHSDPDAKLANQIRQRATIDIPVIRETDPIQIKKIIGESHFIIASRFHALVSALSQGIPAIGTSWSHKYEMLFDDYSCNHLLLKMIEATGKLSKIVTEIVEDKSVLRARLKEKSQAFQQQVALMWDEVEQKIAPIS